MSTPKTSSTTTPEETPVTFDPYDVEAMRAAPPSVASTDRVILSVACRRPTRKEFIRVHPSSEFIVDTSLLEHEGERGTERYLVPPFARSLVPPEDLIYVRMFVAMSRLGVTFLWPARLPSEDSNLGRSWHESALAAAEMAMKHWVKVSGNRAAGRYEVLQARGDLGEPEWPEMDMRTLFSLAFDAEHTVTDANHDVLRLLRGEI